MARARTDDVDCVHYISTVQSCDVRRVLCGNIMNSFWPMTARAFLWKFLVYNTIKKVSLWEVYGTNRAGKKWHGPAKKRADKE